MDPTVTLKPYLAAVREKKIDHAAVIETSTVFTEPWVKLKCQFGCDRYGKSFCCPPNTPSPKQMRELLDSYTHAILLHRRWQEGVTDVTEFNETVVDLELTLFLDGYYKAWSVGSGPCKRCQTCNTAERCLKATRARPSMEACGIDVFRTVREHGFPIQVLTSRDDRRDSYGLVLVE
jgi:predicted metal-binding protein